MIVEVLAGMLFGLVGLLVAALPDGSIPSWVVDNPLAGLIGQFGGMGAWVPLGLAFTVVAAVLLAYAVGFAIKAVRIVASFLTAGGGSAA